MHLRECKHWGGVICALILVACLNNRPAIAQPDSDVTVFYNGHIFTANPAALMVEAVAVKSNRIIAVGDLENVKSKAGPGATLLDLKGNTLLPGLIDTHNHAISGGRSLLTAHLQDNFIEADSLKAYARYAISSGLGLYGDVLYIDGLHSNTWKSTSMLQTIFEAPEFQGRSVLLQGSEANGLPNKAMLRLLDSAEFIKPPEEIKRIWAYPGGSKRRCREGTSTTFQVGAQRFNTLMRSLPIET